MSDNADAEKKREAGDPIWDGPSYFVNIAYAVSTPYWLRIAFGEQGGRDEPARHRVAITMTPPEAVAFFDTLRPLIENYRSALDAAAAMKAQGR